MFLEQIVPGYLGAVRSPRTQCIQFIEKDHTRGGIPGSLEHLSDGSLTFANILKYRTKLERHLRSSSLTRVTNYSLSMILVKNGGGGTPENVRQDRFLRSLIL